MGERRDAGRDAACRRPRERRAERARVAPGVPRGRVLRRWEWPTPKSAVAERWGPRWHGTVPGRGGLPVRPRRDRRAAILVRRAGPVRRDGRHARGHLDPGDPAGGLRVRALVVFPAAARGGRSRLLLPAVRRWWVALRRMGGRRRRGIGARATSGREAPWPRVRDGRPPLVHGGGLSRRHAALARRRPGRLADPRRSRHAGSPSRSSRASRITPSSRKVRIIAVRSGSPAAQTRARTWSASSRWTCSSTPEAAVRSRSGRSEGVVDECHRAKGEARAALGGRHAARAVDHADASGGEILEDDAPSIPEIAGEAEQVADEDGAERATSSTPGLGQEALHVRAVERRTTLGGIPLLGDDLVRASWGQVRTAELERRNREMGHWRGRARAVVLAVERYRLARGALAPVTVVGGEGSWSGVTALTVAVTGRRRRRRSAARTRVPKSCGYAGTPYETNSRGVSARFNSAQSSRRSVGAA
jgi:hypothetical protein